MIDYTYYTFEEFMSLKDAPDIDSSESARIGWNAAMAVWGPVHDCDKCRAAHKLFMEAISVLHMAKDGK